MTSRSTIRKGTSVAMAAATATLIVTSGHAAHGLDSDHDFGRPIRAQAAFSCDFTLDLANLTEAPGAAIERDRVLMQRFAREFTNPDHPGMIQKHIPLFPISQTRSLAGGRYLFEGKHQAEQYAEFVTKLFTYPGDTRFLQRPEFSDPECRAWEVVEAWTFARNDAFVAFRTERFDTHRVGPGQEKVLFARLRRKADDLIDLAHSRGYAEIHILHSSEDHKVQLVYFMSRMSPVSPTQPDVVALGKISSDPALGDFIASRLGLTRVYDQSHFVLTKWLPYRPGDRGAPAAWPNSPPFPEPFCGDDVCIPSRGESGSSCAVDCTVTCGNKVCDAGESLTTCPSDCEVPLAR
jgi:hypothetical protein